MDTTDSAYGDKLIRLDTFDTAVAVDPSAEDDAKRRFMTLILQTAHRNNGNIGHVLRATNTSGEVFAVKLLKDNAILSGQAPDRSAEQSAAHLASTAALFEEYRHLCTVSHLRGFPRVYARMTLSSSWSGSRAPRSSRRCPCFLTTPRAG